MNARLRLILIAPCCNGRDVGEAWSSFQWVRGIASRHDVTVLTYTRRDRPSLTAQLPGVEVVEWRDLPVCGRYERLNAMLKPGYLAFHHRARRWIGRALRCGRSFDAIWQMAPLAPRYPSPAACFDIPYLIGPLAGGLPTPEAFRHETREAGWYMNLRRLDGLRLRADPMLRRTYARASVVLGVAPYMRDVLHNVRLQRFTCEAETGVHQLPPDPPPRTARPGLRLLYVGRVVRTKGLRDAVRAMAHLPASSDITLDVVGDGPDAKACQREAAMLGVGSRIQFHGRVPRHDVDEFYRRCDVFVFPSFREPSGNVVFEAMSFGLPVITADRGGPAQTVRNSCGVRVPVETPARFARDIAGAIALLADDAPRRLAMGEAAAQAVQHRHLWSAKIQRLDTLLRDVVSSRLPVTPAACVGV